MADRRRTMWEDTLFNEALGTGLQLRKAIDGTNSVADSQGMTLTRLIVDLTFLSRTVSGGWGVANVDIGMGLTSREAFTAGVLADPQAETEEPSRGWIYRNRILVSQNGTGTDVIQRITVDLRTQRRLDEGRIFIVVDHLVILGTAFTLHIGGITRALFKLP